MTRFSIDQGMFAEQNKHLLPKPVSANASFTTGAVRRSAQKVTDLDLMAEARKASIADTGAYDNMVQTMERRGPYGDTSDPLQTMERRPPPAVRGDPWDDLVDRGGPLKWDDLVDRGGPVERQNLSSDADSALVRRLVGEQKAPPPGRFDWNVPATNPQDVKIPVRRAPADGQQAQAFANADANQKALLDRLLAIKPTTKAPNEVPNFLLPRPAAQRQGTTGQEQAPRVQGTTSPDADPALVAKADAAAAKHGVDPTILRNLINQESGWNPNARNAKSGAAGLGQFMPGTAQGLGIDPMNPDQAIDGAARYLKQNLDAHGGDVRRALASYNWGPGNVSKWDGKDETLPAETRTYLATIMGSKPPGAPLTTGEHVAIGATAQQQQQAVARGKSVWEAGKLTPNQYTQGLAEGMDRETALAVCGPAAAIAFARKTGRNPTLQEATNLAKQVGWTVNAGMAGPDSQVALLKKMDIPATVEHGAPDAAKVAASVQGGNPVTLSTSGHYFVAEKYDPATGKFDFGESAKVLKKSGGNSWYTLDEIQSLGMGAPRAAIYMQEQ